MWTARASAGLAVEQRGAVERGEQPLVGVDDERVRLLDAGEAVAHARREQRRAAVGAVDVEPQPALARDLAHAGEVVDDAGVGRAGGRHHGAHRRRVAVGVERGAQGGAGQAVVADGDRQRVRRPMMRSALSIEECAWALTAMRQRRAVARAAGARAAALRRVARDDERRQVAGRAARHEAAAGGLRQAGEVGEQSAAPGSPRAPRPRPPATRSPGSRRRRPPCRTAARPWSAPRG